MRPRSTSAVNVQPIPARLGSCWPIVLIQRLSALTILAPARCTSIVLGRSQNPSTNPRTAVSAAMRPPFAPPMPSAIAAITSCRGSGNSAPDKAPAKSSLFLRGPVFDANPMLARTPVSTVAIALLPKDCRLPVSWRDGGASAAALSQLHAVTENSPDCNDHDEN